MPLIQFPNIPNLPGVPQLTRDATATITGAVSGAVTGAMSGGVQGAISSAVSGALPFAAGALIARLPGGIISGALARALQTNFKWGIFDANGKALADPASIGGILGNMLDSVGIGAMLSTNSLDYSKETRISDFPVEGGQFASYNKVEMSGVVNVTLTMSGNESARQKFLSAIDAASKSTDLYSVVTPSATYVNYNVEKYNYQRRGERGAGLIIVDLSLREVRQVSAAYASTLSAPGADQIGKPADAGAAPAQDLGRVQPKDAAKSILATAASKIKGFAASIFK